MSYRDDPIVALSPRQAIWVRMMPLVEANATEAAALVYHCRNRKTARQIGYKNRRMLRHAHTLTTDKDLLPAGQRFARRLAKAARANKARRFHLAGGQVLVCEVPDWRTRLRAMRRICRLAGWLPQHPNTVADVLEALRSGAANEILFELTPRFLQLIAEGKAPPYRLSAVGPQTESADSRPATSLDRTVARGG